jgi:hypothetical protein
MFPDPTYIDEYSRARTIKPAPPIFIGEDMSPMNIGHVYASVTWSDRRIYGSGQSQTGHPIYLLVPDKNRRI